MRRRGERGALRAFSDDAECQWHRRCDEPVRVPLFKGARGSDAGPPEEAAEANFFRRAGVRFPARGRKRGTRFLGSRSISAQRPSRFGGALALLEPMGDAPDRRGPPSGRLARGELEMALWRPVGFAVNFPAGVAEMHGISLREILGAQCALVRGEWDQRRRL